MNPLKGQERSIAITGAFALFVLVSHAAGFGPGRALGTTFLHFLLQMLKVLPCVFILIGLFDVWVERETVEKHLGRESGALSYVWMVLLAGTMVGGLHVALPVGHALRMKGARLSLVVTFLTASTVCRVPMALFEAGFLGWRFTCIRLAVSLPLILLSSMLLGGWCDRRGYRLPEVAGAD